MTSMNYKMVFIPAFGEPAQFEKEYETHAEAETARNAVADYTLLLHECSYMPDHANCGMVLMKDGDGDWVEIDGEGEEI